MSKLKVISGSTEESVLEALANLPMNTLFLVRGKQTINGDKVYLEFQERIVDEDAPINAIGLLNASDERFTKNNDLRHCWQSVEKEDAEALFGVDLTEASKSEEWVWLGTPLVGVASGPYAGRRLHLKITEDQTVRKSDWTAKTKDGSMEGPAVTAKQDGNGNYCLKANEDGEYHPIFRRSTVVINKTPVFRTLQHDTLGELPAEYQGSTPMLEEPIEESLIATEES